MVVMRPILYMDKDGVILANEENLAIGASEFIKFATNNFEVYWLTNHCINGDPAHAIEYIQRATSDNLRPYLEKFKPTTWRITVADYDKYVTKTKAEMDELDRKLVEFTNNDKSFVVTAEYLLKLASNAKKIFESSQPPQKNKILRTLLANPTLNQKTLQLPLLKPFSTLVFDLKTKNWLRGLDSNQRPSG